MFNLKKHIFIQFIACILFVSVLQAQKPALDTSSFDKWPMLSAASISAEGNFLTYQVSNRQFTSNTSVIKSIDEAWEHKFDDCQKSAITNDEKFAVFLDNAGSLSIIDLNTKKIRSISNVGAFRTFKNAPDILSYYMASISKLSIMELNGTKKWEFENVSEYAISEDGKKLFIISWEPAVNTEKIISYINLSTGDRRVIYKGINPSSLLLNNDFTKLAFLSNEGLKGKSIWYYSLEMDASNKVINAAPSVIDGLEINNISKFNKQGNRLFITLRESVEIESQKKTTVKVDVWNYQDKKLQSQQLKEVKPKSFAAVLDLNSKEIIRLQYPDDERLVFFDKNDDRVFIINRTSDYGERQWNRYADATYFLTSLKNGKREQVDYLIRSQSQSGTYLIIENNSGNYYSYNDVTGKNINLTRTLPIIKDQLDGNLPRNLRGLAGIAGWMENEKAVIVYSKYDIWQLDVAGIKKPINLTSGLGQKEKIIFRIAEINGQLFKATQKLILTAFNTENKKSGFYTLQLGTLEEPKCLSMDDVQYSENDGQLVLKAEKANVYLVQRGSTSKFPNLFSTSNFKSFKIHSDLFPEQNFNWVKSELIFWTTFSGRKAKGVLYKPENFDPTKKYPIIFHYYESLSNRLNEYKFPNFCEGWINIPWFVSNGYLVFTPDILYEKGRPGESALDCVVSAARYLCHFSFVDSSKMGLQGHSFGGFETNFIIAHSKIFSAACSAAGVVNLVSGYGALWGNGNSKIGAFENGQFRIFFNPWERRDLYLRNSPILDVSKITTPLLVMHNSADKAVSFAQGVEFFTSLRRLGKISWMLQYDGEEHSLLENKNKIDFTIRLTQFFNHYLKDSACPKWMFYGIPATRKGIDNGYELIKETQPKTGQWVTPKEGGVLTYEERKKVEALKSSKPVKTTTY